MAERLESAIKFTPVHIYIQRNREEAGRVFSSVLDLVSQVRDVVLMNVYLDLGTLGGRDFGIGGI